MHTEGNGSPYPSGDGMLAPIPRHHHLSPRVERCCPPTHSQERCAAKRYIIIEGDERGRECEWVSSKCGVADRGGLARRWVLAVR